MLEGRFNAFEKRSHVSRSCIWSKARMVGSGPRVKVTPCTWRLVGRCVMACYDVALWRWWPALFPECVCLMDAPNAFAAVEALMRACGLRRVAYASARRVDGSL